MSSRQGPRRVRAAGASRNASQCLPGLDCAPFLLAEANKENVFHTAHDAAGAGRGDGPPAPPPSPTAVAAFEEPQPSTSVSDISPTASASSAEPTAGQAPPTSSGETRTAGASGAAFCSLMLTRDGRAPRGAQVALALSSISVVVGVLPAPRRMPKVRDYSAVIFHVPPSLGCHPRAVRSTWQPPVCAGSLDLPVLDIPLRRILCCVAFCVWLPSLGIMFPRLV